MRLICDVFGFVEIAANSRSIIGCQFGSNFLFTLASSYELVEAASVVASIGYSIEGETSMLRRHEITDDQWDARQGFLSGQAGDPSVAAKEIACSSMPC